MQNQYHGTKVSGFTAKFWTLLDVSQSNFLQLTEAKTLRKFKFHGQFVFQKLQHFSFKADEKKIVSELPCMMQNVLYIDK